ncbi:MAG: HD-GYP domain-containing protein [Janthinobacterium lividum]
MIALHPTIGAELLAGQQYCSKRVINIVRRHHERLDGSGYPDGWRTRRTAKPVRIVAVCDALCAMTEQRPYEDAWPMQEALERLKSMPEQYDQEPLKLLERMFNERGTNLQIYETMSPLQQRSSKRSSGVLRPRSAFYAPRSRRNARTVN